MGGQTKEVCLSPAAKSCRSFADIKHPEAALSERCCRACYRPLSPRRIRFRHWFILQLIFVAENNAKVFWSAQTGVSLGLWRTMVLNSLFKAFSPADSTVRQLSREGRSHGGGVRRPGAGWAAQQEGVPEGRAASRMGERAQQPPSLQTLSVRVLPQPSPICRPTGTFFFTVGLAGRCGSTFRAALSQREDVQCLLCSHKLWHLVLPP